MRFKVVHHLGHFTVRRGIPLANVQSYHPKRGGEVNVRLQILETEENASITLLDIEKFGVRNQFTICPVKTKN